MTFGKLLAAVAGLVVVVSAAEMYDTGVAMALAALILLAILFHYRAQLTQLIATIPGH
jgi:hypothetical protein